MANHRRASAPPPVPRRNNQLTGTAPRRQIVLSGTVDDMDREDLNQVWHLLAAAIHFANNIRNRSLREALIDSLNDPMVVAEALDDHLPDAEDCPTGERKGARR